jgi:hypothetical protein
MAMTTAMKLLMITFDLVLVFAGLVVLKGSFMHIKQEFSIRGNNASA